MSFENEQYVSSRIDKIEALEQEITRLRKQLAEATEVIKLSKQTLHLSKSSIGYEQYCDSLNKFLAKYLGGVNEYIKSMSNMWE